MRFFTSNSLPNTPKPKPTFTTQSCIGHLLGAPNTWILPLDFLGPKNPGASRFGPRKHHQPHAAPPERAFARFPAEQRWARTASAREVERLRTRTLGWWYIWDGRSEAAQPLEASASVSERQPSFAAWTFLSRSEAWIRVPSKWPRIWPGGNHFFLIGPVLFKPAHDLSWSPFGLRLPDRDQVICRYVPPDQDPHPKQNKGFEDT